MIYLLDVVIEIAGDSALDWAQAVFGFVVALAAVGGVVFSARAAQSAAASAGVASRALQVSEAQAEPHIIVVRAEANEWGDPQVIISATNPATPAVNTSLLLTLEALGATHRVPMRLGVLREADDARRVTLWLGGGLQYAQDGGVASLIAFTISGTARDNSDSVPSVHAMLRLHENELDEHRGFDGVLSVSAECDGRIDQRRRESNVVSFPFRVDFTDDDLELIGGPVTATMLPASAEIAQATGAATAGVCRFTARDDD